ncbi:MAG: hypothetical protein CSA29_03515 [Desulfobacterales bacterium]|nr:MAG: hypothetical protein CSA29_03515 [Desulfobacterales bacterium]
MIQKFNVKDIHFLKADGVDDAKIIPPDTYLSDLIHTPTVQFTSFKDRFSQISLPLDHCIAAVIRIDPNALESVREESVKVFESNFNGIFSKDKGLWEQLDEGTYALVFWEYPHEKNGIAQMSLLKEKIETQLQADLTMGLALYPFHTFSKDDILGNALKALDHAAFYKPGRTIPFDALSLNISGDRLYQIKKYPEAIQEYEQGLRLSPKDINLINSLGVTYGINNQLDKALDCFEQASAIDPEEAMVIYNIGLIHRINNNEDQAMHYLKKARSLNSDIFEIELLLGYLLFKNGQHDKAMPHLDAAIALKPESGIPFRIKGEIFLDQNNAQAAGAAFTMAVKRNPSDAVSLSGYAHAMARQEKNLGIALSFAQKSVAMVPDNILFSQRLAEIQDIHDQAMAQRQANAIKSA